MTLSRRCSEEARCGFPVIWAFSVVGVCGKEIKRRAGWHTAKRPRGSAKQPTKFHTHTKYLQRSFYFSAWSHFFVLSTLGSWGFDNYFDFALWSFRWERERNHHFRTEISVLWWWSLSRALHTSRWVHSTWFHHHEKEKRKEKSSL